MAENERNYLVKTFLDDEEHQMLEVLLNEFDTDEEKFLRVMIRLFYKMKSEETA